MPAPEKPILVVDDEADARTYLVSLLKDNGYAVTEAKDGAEALEKVKTESPALVTLDMSMPEKSGVAVYRALKENEAYKRIPVIIVTGVSNEFEQFISTRKQVPAPEGYIAKPVEAEPFMAKVGELLAQ